MLIRSCARRYLCVSLVIVGFVACHAFVAAAAPDVVLHAVDATNLHGNWSLGSDSSAADGQQLAGTDNGFSQTSTALASPSDYFDFTFNAAANTPYHVWFRLRAAGDSKFNDSVYAQFSDATDGGGTGIFQIGTTSSLVINLQRCNGCALSDWGWMDGAYWLSQTSTVSFASNGTHTLRIQTREDGVGIDQVVLSPSSYLSAAPGPQLSDNTIVPRTTSTTPPPSASSTPYSGSPAAIPGTVQAAAFDLGGEGVGYHDTTSGNSGGAFRTGDVDIEPSSRGGFDVGWVDADEWLNYGVNVATAGTYTISFVVASSGSGGTFHLEMNRTDVTGSLTIPDTGGWQAWQTVKATVTLAAGAQVARLVADSRGAAAVGNFATIQFAAAATSAGSAFAGTAAGIPGTIAAADFDNGASGVAYSDSTSGNAGGAYRQTDVDIEPSSEGGYDVGWTAHGEWLNYQINVAASGSYTLQLRVASPGGASMHIDFNAPSNASTSAAIPPTGGWQAWTTVSVPVTLAAGPQTMTLHFDSSGFNIRAINAIAGSTASPPPSGGGSGGGTITVPAGGNLQQAIDAALPGDTILLQAGATFAGTFVLPAKSGSSFVTIRSAAADASLPAAGVRVTPSNAGQLARVQGGFAGMPAFVTALGAHHYRLMFLEIVNTYANNDIIELGDGSSAQNTLATVAHDLVIDRCYIHGDAANGQKRGIALNSATTSIVNSYISDIKSAQSEAQGIAGWNGPGPYTITNNYIEGTGENILFGGSDPSIPNLVPSDIIIRQNYITKPLSWRSQGWTIKNLIELKNAQRVTIDGNMIENCWAAGQQGFAVMFTPRNQEGTAPWSIVQQVVVTNNVIRHVASGFDISGVDDANTSGVTNAITIRNNLLLDIGGTWGGQGRTLVTLGGSNMTFDHNTVFSDGSSVVYADVGPIAGFTFTNNIVPDNIWAIMGSGASAGNGTIAAYYPGGTLRRNVFIAGSAATYPTDNYFPANVSLVQFRDVNGGDYSLASGSTYTASATDGSAIGADMATINALVPLK